MFPNPLLPPNYSTHGGLYWRIYRTWVWLRTSWLIQHATIALHTLSCQIRRSLQIFCDAEASVGHCNLHDVNVNRKGNTLIVSSARTGSTRLLTSFDACLKYSCFGEVLNSAALHYGSGWESASKHRVALHLRALCASYWWREPTQHLVCKVLTDHYCYNNIPLLHIVTEFQARHIVILYRRSLFATYKSTWRAFRSDCWHTVGKSATKGTASRLNDSLGHFQPDEYEKWCNHFLDSWNWTLDAVNGVCKARPETTVTVLCYEDDIDGKTTHQLLTSATQTPVDMLPLKPGAVTEQLQVQRCSDNLQDGFCSPIPHKYLSQQLSLIQLPPGPTGPLYAKVINATPRCSREPRPHRHAQM
eukprot:m.256552 g.256552  ORF g.256552 m.256552 type:complete len:359 (+) comp15522_c1_seq4:63-1139(+)